MTDQDHACTSHLTARISGPPFNNMPHRSRRNQTQIHDTIRPDRYRQITHDRTSPVGSHESPFSQAARVSGYSGSPIPYVTLPRQPNPFGETHHHLAIPFSSQRSPTGQVFCNCAIGLNTFFRIGPGGNVRSRIHPAKLRAANSALKIGSETSWPGMGCCSGFGLWFEQELRGMQ